MKTLKFKDFLVPKVLDGSKTVTWRLFDDKDLQAGDELTLINKDTGEEFAKARIVLIREKTLAEVDEADFEEEHEKYESEEDMLKHYREYYGDKISLASPLKIVEFEISP